MSSSCVAELDSLLTSMLELKPPGVSTAKISAITSLCNANVQFESSLIQKVYAHFKKAPPNKKLGVLYVVDSVTRQWFEQARKGGQALGPSAGDGTYAAGVKHVTELLPNLMQDIISVSPEDHKVKIKKLIDIWERGNTFPAQMLSSFREKLNAPTTNAQSHTPTGTPPQNFLNPIPMTNAAPPPQTQDTTSIIEKLKNLAEAAKNNSTTPVGNAAPQGSSSNVSFLSNAFPQGLPPVNPVHTMQPPAPAVNAPTPVNSGVMSSYGGGGLPQNFFPNGQMPAQAQQPQPPALPVQNNSFAPTDTLQQQLQILAALKAQGIPQEQWPALLSVLMSSAGAGNAAAGQPQPPPNPGLGRDEQMSRDRSGYDQQRRSPPSGRYRGRSRSRSPGWERRREDSPHGRRRDSPVYGEYGGNGSSGRSGDNDRRSRNDRGRGGRQRSPNRFRRSPSPRRNDVPPNTAPKWVEYDSTLPRGSIKVFSRTLFVGGVTAHEDELRSIFSKFGRVQSCLVNIDKRHAFVKMISRDEAVRAKDGMENFKHPDMQLRTRWGVGYGPRDCSDYQTGISIIPIDRLTDADRKWMLTAEYGGSGGKPIDDGLCVEEPDIEIGAGVSSKAISRRMQTDKSGTHGPRSTRDPPRSDRRGDKHSYDQHQDYSQQEQQQYQPQQQHPNQDRDGPGSGNANNNGVAPTVPSFNFQFPMLANAIPGGISAFPNYSLPNQNPAQPPPPGAT